jgi:hypothetical protein
MSAVCVGVRGVGWGERIWGGAESVASHSFIRVASKKSAPHFVSYNCPQSSFPCVFCSLRLLLSASSALCAFCSLRLLPGMPPVRRDQSMAGSEMLMDSQEAREAAAADAEYEDQLEEGEHQRGAGASAPDLTRQETIGEFDDVPVGTRLGGGARLGRNPAFQPEEKDDDDEGEGEDSPGADPADASASGAIVTFSQEVGNFDDDDDDDDEYEDDVEEETWDEWVDGKTSKQIYDKILVEKKKLAEHNRSKDLVAQTLKEYAQANKDRAEEPKAQCRDAFVKVKAWVSEDWFADMSDEQLRLFSQVCLSQVESRSFYDKQTELRQGISILDIALAETAAAEAVLKYSKKVDKADRHHGAVTKKRKTKKPDRLAPSVKKSRWGLSGSK